MKTLEKYVKNYSKLFEAKSLTQDEFKDLEKENEENANAAVGKDADKNGTHGKYDIDPPYSDNDEVPDISPEQLTRNLKTLSAKFRAGEPFFIQGEAGWGKTEIIVDLAKRFGKHVITVYLDKIEATDLSGIPCAVENKKTGRAAQQLLLPEWAQYMLDNPDKEFLLFLDEMNQAAPDVMNALMPIVKDNKIGGMIFKNFMVGAAGNFERENAGGISELSKPLESRFKPIIIWETNTEASWKAAFKYIRKKYENTIGKDIIDNLEKCKDIFYNPREIEQKVIKYILTLKSDENYKKRKKFLAGLDEQISPEDIKDRIVTLSKFNDDPEKISRSDDKRINDLTDSIFSFYADINNNKETKQSNKTRKQVPKDTIDLIEKARKNGYILFDGQDGKQIKGGISLENLFGVFTDVEILDDLAISAEQLQQILDQYEIDGKEFKYKTNDEFKSKNIMNPLD